MNSNSPIGVFDSGLGGLTVLKALRQLLPQENIIFVGDSARAPYGSRTPTEIKEYLAQFANYFKSRGVKMAICACNTMTSHGIQFMREWDDFSLIPMNPAIIPAVKASPNKHIGVIATEATINKGMHRHAANVIDPGIQVYGVACPKFVPLIEQGIISGDAIESAVEEYHKEFQGSDIHSLILGCTHYPIIQDVLRQKFGPEVELVNPAMETAKHAMEVLTRKKLLHTKPEQGTLELLFSAPASNTAQMAKVILNIDVPTIGKVDLSKYTNTTEE